MERVRVGFLDAAHRALQRLSHVGRDSTHIAPVAILRNLKAVVLRESGILFVAARFLDRGALLFVVDIGDALEEE